MADALAARPPRAAVATGLRALTAADAAFDRQIFDEDRGAPFAPLRLDDAMLATLLDQQFDAQQAGTRNSFPDAEHFVIEQNGDAVGRLTTALIGADESRALHVIAIVVAAAVRGRGIGTAMLMRLGEAARAQGARRLTLSVLRSNDGARRLYERLGFRAAADDDASPYIAMVKPLT